MSILSFEHVSISHEGIPTLTDINLSVEAGDFYYMTNELNDTYMRAVKVLQENQMKDFKVQHY